jgi:hypothetical protein
MTDGFHDFGCRERIAAWRGESSAQDCRTWDKFWTFAETHESYLNIDQPPKPMKTHRLRAIWLGVAILTSLSAPHCVHAGYLLIEYAYRLDGVVTTSPGSPPPGSVFDTTTGLGTISFTLSGSGPHSAYLFVDHELSEPENTFFNELGNVSAVPPPSGLSWEIDEPGFVFGDIYNNFLLGTLDNSIGTLLPEDVSMAMGWDFVLGAGQTGLVEFMLGTAEPAGFYVRHHDPDSGESVYFASQLTIRSVPIGVPDRGIGGPFVLAAMAAGLGLWRRVNRGSNITSGKARATG